MERRGETSPASGIGGAAKEGWGNGWSAIRTTQESMPDWPLAVGNVSCAWVIAASAVRGEACGRLAVIADAPLKAAGRTGSKIERAGQVEKLGAIFVGLTADTEHT